MKKIVILSDRPDRNSEFTRLIRRIFPECEIKVRSKSEGKCEPAVLSQAGKTSEY